MDSIEEIFRKNYKELCILSYYYLKDINEAKDVVQDVFVKIIEQNKLKELKNSESYFKTAVRNTSLKRIQKRKKTDTLSNHNLFYNPANTEEQEAIALKNKIELYKQIDLLPEQCKNVFLLCVLNDLKYKEAAEVLKISINTVKTQMKKAFKILRSSLKDTHLLLFLFSQEKIYSKKIKLS
ncbi:RNA polymerase sigma factor [Flavivirga spongiicola]|uniref:Sigma-70 family RNA polymerase sigma factor n=1 Tax=Flavivirga spongiicola TaxID=421621 RepID=A0ABU7XVK6_9FLAO|nr:sigma-70 family RNA polymerase sigma factor [Flavivirga sp. MEBiC05379]MDO5979782.1 sigma-70 family RNA polymerase sigma factor [Flavivirga sp. MEBiC05379]